MYYKRGGRRWRRSRYSHRRQMSTAWWNSSAASLTGFSAANREYQGIICRITDIDPLAAAQLDWGRAGQKLLERVILTVAVAVTNAAIKKLLRVIIGVRIQELDFADALPTSFSSLDFSTVRARQEDWLYQTELDVQTNGDAAAVYSPAVTPTVLDFKPRRKFEQRQALVIQARWGDMTDAGPDANMSLAYNAKLLLMAR